MHQLVRASVQTETVTMQQVVGGDVVQSGGIFLGVRIGPEHATDSEFHHQSAGFAEEGGY